MFKQIISPKNAIIVAMILSPFALAQISDSFLSPSLGQPLCADIDDLTPSQITRTVEFQTLGIRVTIPENFRTLLRNDGSISIVAPGDFNLLRCIAEGMPAQGTESVTMQTFRVRPNPENFDLKTFALEDSISNLTDRINIQTINKIDLLIRQREDAQDGMSLVYGLFQVDEIDGIIEVTLETKEQLIDLFNRTQLLSEADAIMIEPERMNEPDNIIVRALNAVKDLGYADNSDREIIVRENNSSNLSGQSTVMITQEGLQDDSIAGQQFTVQFQSNTQDQWDIISVKKRWKCQLERGAQDYNTEPCL